MPKSNPDTTLNKKKIAIMKPDSKDWLFCLNFFFVWLKLMLLKINAKMMLEGL